MRILLSAYLVLCLFVCFTYGWPAGAPESTCSIPNSLPRHGTNRAITPLSPAPVGGYKFTFPGLAAGVTPTYTTPYPISIKFSSVTSVANTAFTGYFITAYSTRTNAKIGQFSYNDTESQFICNNQCYHCALTQKTGSRKTDIEFNWIPPETTGSGSIVVNVTVITALTVVHELSYLITEIEGTAPPDVMAAPAIIDATLPTANGTDILIGWTKPFNGSNPIRNYILSWRQSAPVSTAFTVLYRGLALSYQLPRLLSGSVYEFRIQANNSRVNDPSPILTITPPDVDTPTPPVPTHLAQSTTAASTTTSVTLTWSNTPANTSAAQFIGYILEMRHTLPSNSTFQVVYQGMPATATISGLDHSSSYTFRVRSRSLSGLSGYSATAIGKTTGSTCSGVGSFVARTSTCRCPTGYLGLECEIESPFVGGTMPCFGEGRTFCFDFTTSDGTLYGRLQGKTNPDADSVKGYVSLGFGAEDGMTGADMWVFTVPTQDEAVMYNTYSSGFVSPSIKQVGILPKANFSGFYNDTHLDVTFVRGLDIGIEGELVLSEHDITQVGWAQASSYFARHGTGTDDRGRTEIIFGTRTVVELGEHTENYSFYAPFCAAIGVIVLTGIIFRCSKSAMRSSLGIFLLRQRPSTICFAPTPITSTKEDNLVVKLGPPMKKTWKRHVNTFIDTVTFDFRRAFIDWTWGEVIAFGLYVIGLVVSIIVGYSKYTTASYRRPMIFGHLSSIQMALLFFPVVRNSIWLNLLGISYERALKFHRVMARITLIFVIVHFITMDHLFGREMLSQDMKTKYGDGAVHGFISFIALGVTIVLSWEPIRRRFWDAFLVSHLILFPVTIIFACLHNYQVRYYLAAPLFLYVVDRLVRFIRSMRQVEIVSMKVLNGATASDPTIARVIRLEVTQPQGWWRRKPFQFSPGDYCFLNVPAISHFAAHPFSMSSSPYSLFGSSLMTFHIIDMGPGSFTYNLIEYLIQHVEEDRQPSEEMPIFKDGVLVKEQPTIQIKKLVQPGTKHPIKIPCGVDGPYGSLSVPLEDYSTIVLVAGGIGITPLYSILTSLLIRQHTPSSQPRTVRKIHLIWASRVPSAFREYFPELVTTIYTQFHSILKLHFFFDGRMDKTFDPIIDPTQPFARSATFNGNVTLHIDPMQATSFVNHPLGSPSSMVIPHSDDALPEVSHQGVRFFGLDDDHTGDAIDGLASPSAGEVPAAAGPTVTDVDASPSSPPPPPEAPPAIPAPVSSYDSTIRDNNSIEMAAYPSASAVLEVRTSTDNISEVVKNLNSKPPLIQIHVGRPNLAAVFDHIKELHQSDSTFLPPGFVAPPQSKHVAVYACGPAPLCEVAQARAMVNGWHMHRETFAF